VNLCPYRNSQKLNCFIALLLEQKRTVLGFLKVPVVGAPSKETAASNHKGKCRDNGKGKIKVALTERHAMKTYWGVEVQLHAFSTLVMYVGEWSASGPGGFSPREITPGTHWIGGWVGLRAGLDAVVKRKFPSPCWDWNP
jgi:hypothetical protein